MNSTDIGLDWELKQKHKVVEAQKLLGKAIASLGKKVARAQRDLEAGRTSEIECFDCTAHSLMISRLAKELGELQP